MEIQSAKISDLKDFHTMVHLFQEHHYNAKSDYFINPKHIIFDRLSYKQLIEDQNRCILFAREDNRLAGMLMITIIKVSVGDLQYPRTHPTIEMVVVQEKFRRKGVAKMLIEAAYQWSRLKGFDEVVTDVWAFSDSAMKLFADEGFGVRSTRLFKKI